MTASDSKHRIEERVQAFIEAAGTDSAIVIRFKEQLLSQWERNVKDTRRAALWIVAAMVGFELFNRNLIGEVSILSLKLSRLSVIPLVLPPVVAYFVLQLWQKVRLIYLISEAYWKLSKHTCPELYSTDLELLVTPEPELFVTSVPSSLIGDGSESVFAFTLRVIQAIVVAFTPFVFWIYAYTQLFSRRSVYDAGTWVSLAVTVLLVGVTLASSREDRVVQLGETPQETKARFRKDIRRIQN